MTIKPKGEYGSKWGLTDLYDDFAPEVKAAIEAKNDFMMEWGSKKEIRYVTIERENGVINITCTSEVDEPESILDTAIWEATGKIFDDGYTALSVIFGDQDIDNFFETMTSEMLGLWLYEESHRYSVRVVSNNFDEVMEMISNAENEAETRATDTYNSIVEFATEYILYHKTSEGDNAQ